MTSVCIIGAGLSGLTSIKSCLEEGLEPTCYETCADAAGLWNHNASKQRKDGARLYSALITNLSKEMSGFSDFPMPKEYPMYLRWEHMYKFLRLYAEQFDLMGHIKFQHKVINVEHIESDSKTSWGVTVRDKISGNQFKKTFDKLIVCVGQYNRCPIPQFKGIETFKGQILHSAKYNSEDEFKGMRVVVVASSNSGCDLACGISNTAESTYLASRAGAMIARRLQGGYPLDMKNFSRFKTVVRNMVSDVLTDRLIYSIFNKDFDHKTYGLESKFRPTDPRAVWVVNDELPLCIASNKVAVVPEVASLDGDSVHLVNGEVLENIDVIYCATGYQPSFPFLPKSIMEDDVSKLKTYKWVFPLTISDPSSMAVVGCYPFVGESRTSTAEMQGRYAASVFAGTTKLPSTKKMLEYYESEHDHMMKSGRFAFKLPPQVYSASMAKELGVYPSFWKLLFTDPLLAFAVFFGPTVPYIYRLTGRNNCPEMRDRILNAWNNTFMGFNHR